MTNESAQDLFGEDATAQADTPFSQAQKALNGAAAFAPLAEQLRPRVLDDLVGQSHLLGAGKPLRIAFEENQPHSMILWGPPGVGKTTLARMMADYFDCKFIALSAVFSGVKEIREAAATAQRYQAQGMRVVLFVDEVHRFNKAQQDAFLPYVESGAFIFVGATTENPSFEVNSALLSRTRVYVLQPLLEADLEQLLKRALAQAEPELKLSEAAMRLVIGSADGDARQLLNQLEQLISVAKSSGRSGDLDDDFVAESLAQSLRRFDKGGDAFFDQISALHKSVRGSNPDASLYWLCRMLDGGTDPRYLARRIVRIAWEDISLADPRAITISMEAAQTYERLGSPEGELALANAVIYLAIAPKSNAAYRAYQAASDFVSQDTSRAVPMHLRNAPTNLMKGLGHGKDYRYAHNEEDAYAAGEQYFPEGMESVQWYKPVLRGLEIKIAEKLERLRALDDEATGQEPKKK